MKTNLLAKEEAERKSQLETILKTGTFFYAAPLFLLFLIIDYFYYPNHLREFILIRVTTVILILLLSQFATKLKNSLDIELVCALTLALCSFSIHLMVLLINTLDTPYPLGLALIIIGASSGFRLSNAYYYLVQALILVPSVVLLPLLVQIDSFQTYAFNSILLLSFFLVGLVNRTFNEKLHKQDFESRAQLEIEVVDRQHIIERKTEESTKLNLLSKQFSPQVTEAIKQGQLEIDKPVHRSNICVIFIDIVDSTKKLLRLDKKDQEQVITGFMEICMEALLKHDITIDKFLGDGVLAFSNAPRQDESFIENTLLSATEVRNQLQEATRSKQFSWPNNFQVRIGISCGFASVGFFGSPTYFKTYTAIGKVVNLSKRISDSAGPWEICVSQDIVRAMAEKYTEISRFHFEKREYKKLSGFEDEEVQTYRLLQDSDLSKKSQSSQKDNYHCPFGHGTLEIAVNSHGIFVFECKECTYQLDYKSIELFEKKSKLRAA